MNRFLQSARFRTPKSRVSIYSVMPLLMFLLIWNPIVAFAANPTCVVKLKFSSDDKADSGTDAFVKQVLTAQGYKVIDDWLFTIWSASDYDVKIVIVHTVSRNYGFPVSLMGMHLFIADSSGTVLVDDDIDRANLEGDLQASIPSCYKRIAVIDATAQSPGQRAAFSAPADVGRGSPAAIPVEPTGPTRRGNRSGKRNGGPGLAR